ncbi:MAG: galactosyldiacylglycerol synthase [Chloroflexaceae bacterium]|nr:galactosyldiacylglycerol synthase [Chloroflexaceae bacterium]
MNILLVFSETGAGHRSAAVAISAALHDASGGTVKCEFLDILQTTGFPLLRDAPGIYDQFSTRLLPFYNLLFRLTNGSWQINQLSRLVFWWSQFQLVRAILTTRPHLVVSTHPLVQRLVNGVRQTYDLSFRFVTVVTDLATIHAAWCDPDVDQCLVPTNEAGGAIRRLGMPPHKMQFTGFPVHPKFARSVHTQVSARRELGVAEDVFTILVTSGGVGSGRMDELVLDLEQRGADQQLLVVTGKNRALYEKLRLRCRGARTHIYGFVDNMDVLMAASDIVITKAGPGTLMEALVMRRPVLLTTAVGLQEEGNIDFVKAHQVGFSCPTMERMMEAVQALTDRQRYAETVARLADAVPRDGAAQIARMLLGPEWGGKSQ